MIQIIPAIDIMDGKCVRLTHGDFSSKKTYYEDPIDVALKFRDAGLKRLHLVDLDGARAGSVRNWKVLEGIASKTDLLIDFGGGIKSEKDVSIVFDSGASLATVGSVAVKDEPAFVSWLRKFGPQKFFLGADVRKNSIMIDGWTKDTGIDISDFLQQYESHGVRQVFCTDIEKDGALQGPAFDLYRQIAEKFPGLHLVASGGVSSIDDLPALAEAGCKAVIIGKAIYEGRILMTDLQKFSG